jgi:hypothetical protein
MCVTTKVERYNAFVRLSSAPPARWKQELIAVFPKDPAARQEVLDLLAENASGAEIQVLPTGVRRAVSACLALLLRTQHVH